MNLFKINTTAFEEEDFYVITDLQEQDITEVVQPLVNAERDGYEEYDNQSLFQALMKRYPNNYLYFYEENTIETLSY
jgi:hypothetical protein